jgi:nucleotide-binding universal stress UspA family protein
MYETVLVPVDGSDVSVTAAEEAVEITGAGGVVHALAVIENLPMRRRSAKAEKFEGRDGTEKQRQAEKATAAAAEVVEDAGLEYETTVTEGVPSREIAARADAIGADAIVVGKRGASASAGEILGSTTERILKNAPTTVVAVPAD